LDEKEESGYQRLKDYDDDEVFGIWPNSMFFQKGGRGDDGWESALQEKAYLVAVKIPH
jgi:hypothetical protein